VALMAENSSTAASNIAVENLSIDLIE